MKLIICAFLLSTILLNNPYCHWTPQKVKNGYRNCEIYEIYYNYDTLIPINSTTSEIPPNAKWRLDSNSKHLVNSFKYDENGNPIDCINFKDGKPHYRYSFKYNEKGRLIERALYDSAGAVKFRNTWVDGFNEDNCQILYTDSTGDLPVKDSIIYDEKGNIRQQVYYDSAGLNRFWDRYDYDEKGNLVERVDYEASVSNIFRYGYKYDGNGFMIESSFADKHSMKPRITIYKNDIYGNILEIVHYGYCREEPDFIYVYIYSR